VENSPDRYLENSPLTVVENSPDNKEKEAA